jgi:siderophore synthetase component
MSQQPESLSHQLTFTVLINCYLREFENHSLYNLVPAHDPELATYILQSGNTELIKIELHQTGVEIYCPLSYYAATGRHVFKFPIVYRKNIGERILPLNCLDFAQLMLDESNHSKVELSAHFKADIFLFRLKDTIRNLSTILNYRILEDKNLSKIAKQHLPFIEAEQALILGHSMHPLAKNRLGFDADDFFRYSPEFNKAFKLFYFLAHPSIVLEDSATTNSATELVKQHLYKSQLATELITKVNDHPEWKLIPMHPWQAAHMLKQTSTKELLKSDLLLELGEAGTKEFLATSSVRTVYAQASDYMYKFSLNVQVTNAERVNLPKELYAGTEISKLFASAWGQNLTSQFPNFCFITDPAYITLTYKGTIINGFSTTLRTNPFRNGNENVTPAASLCQDGIAGIPNRLSNSIRTYAAKHAVTAHQAAKKWFNCYLDILLDPIVKIYNQYGLAIEAHQQNIAVGLDAEGFPQKIYYRDNQGYFIRESFSETVKGLVADFGVKSECIIPDAFIPAKYTYYLLINNIFGFINTLGVNGLITEDELILELYERLKILELIDNTGLVKYILESRSWEVKGNLLMRLNDLNEDRMPADTPALFIDYLNPFMLISHFCKEIISPADHQIKYSRFFEKSNYTLDMRPFDIKQDLEVIHDWVNRDYAKKFWQMDGPIQTLEAFYIKNCCCDYSSSFVGLINGEHAFLIEPYWPMREPVGKYYAARPDDYGFHIMVKPPTAATTSLLINTFRTALEYMFTLSKIGRVIGEADHKNTKLDALTRLVGYKLQEVISMPGKMANLTICTRETYCDKFPELRSQLLEQQQPFTLETELI